MLQCERVLREDVHTFSCLRSPPFSSRRSRFRSWSLSRSPSSLSRFRSLSRPSLSFSGLRQQEPHDAIAQLSQHQLLRHLKCAEAKLAATCLSGKQCHQAYFLAEEFENSTLLRRWITWGRPLCGPDRAPSHAACPRRHARVRALCSSPVPLRVPAHVRGPFPSPAPCHARAPCHKPPH